MRLPRVVLVVLLSAGLLVTVGSGPALACDCVSGQSQAYVDQAEEVVAGTLIRMQDPSTSTSSPVAFAYTFYTVAVDAVFKGGLTHRLEFESPGGASCGLEGMVVDRRYVFFLEVDGDTRSATLCGGTTRATPEVEAALEVVTGAPAHPDTAVDQTPATDSPPTTRFDDEDPARSAVSTWVIAAGLLGLALLAAAAGWLRHRRT